MYNFMDWLSDRPYRMFGAMGVVTVSLVAGAVYLGIQEQKQWDAFAQAHDCKLIAHANGYSTLGSGFANGKVVTVSQYHPSTNTYRCNDGVDYTR